MAVATTITAEWKLAGTDSDARLLAAHDLEEKIRTADLAGTKDKDGESPSAEEEEAAEEMAQMGMYDEPNQPKQGEPMFVYVAKLGKEDRQKAYAEAYADARSRAEQLAAAAGVELGPLHSLSGNSSPLGMQNYGGNRYMQQMYQQMYFERGEEDDEPTGGEAIGPQAHEVKLAVAVEAQFAIKPGAGK